MIAKIYHFLRRLSIHLWIILSGVIIVSYYIIENRLHELRGIIAVPEGLDTDILLTLHSLLGTYFFLLNIGIFALVAIIFLYEKIFHKTMFSVKQFIIYIILSLICGALLLLFEKSIFFL